MDEKLDKIQDKTQSANNCMSMRGTKQRGNLLLEFPKNLQEIATSQSCAPLLAMTAVIGGHCLIG